MNIVLYGISENIAERIASRYDFRLCHSFDDFGDGGSVLLTPPLDTEQRQFDFFERMSEHSDAIDAVITAQSDTFSTVHYCSSFDKLFSVDADDEERLEVDLANIIETRLGLICAHECV